EGLTTVGGSIRLQQNDALTHLSGLENVAFVGGELFVSQHEGLTDLAGLDHLSSIGNALTVTLNPALVNLNGLTRLTSVGASVYITGNDALTGLSGLDSLTTVGDYCYVKENPALSNLDGLGSLAYVNGSMAVWDNPLLANAKGLHRLVSVGGDLIIRSNPGLPDLDSLHHLTTIGGNLTVSSNGSLSSLNGLRQLANFSGGMEITYNPLLAACAIPPVCQRLFAGAAGVTISGNAPGCKSVAEVEENCSATALTVAVKMDGNGDCLPDAGNLPVADAAVWLLAPEQGTLRPTDASGRVDFRYFDNGPCALTLAQFPTANWAVCAADTLPFLPGASPDTILFLLKPLNQCPELTVQLGLPSVFSDCSIVSPVSVSVKNSGTTTAQNVQLAVVMPPEFDLLSALPTPAGQTGDTLFFALGSVLPLTETAVQLTGKTKCSGVPTGRTLCWAAFGTLDNACPVNPPSAAEIQLSAGCTGGKVRFVLKNVGNAPTQGLHEYAIIRNATLQNTKL
ncbi:MAG: hypothetical protein ABIQ93_07890, partial [Saprospiraceae bacterium]